ncbi:MAG: tetratricopeptide repeat protein, partial [Planctomycetota bacterium]
AMTQYATGLSRPDRSRARVFYRRGTVLSGLGRQAEASADLQRAADLDPALKDHTDLPKR